jgi:hypothetical protein
LINKNLKKIKTGGRDSKKPIFNNFKIISNNNERGSEK